jgi:hypothetical protein
MGIRGPLPADQARLGRHELQVRTISVSARFAKREGTFVDVPCDRIVDPPRRRGVFRSGNGSARGATFRRRTMKAIAVTCEHSKARCKSGLHSFAIGRSQGIFGAHGFVRPHSSLGFAAKGGDLSE